MTERTPLFDTYAAIIPDQDKIGDYWQSKLPKTFWINPLRITPEKFQQIVQAENIDCAPVAWHDHVYRAGPDFVPTKHWAYAAGLLQMQEEAAMHCAYVLDPKPGEMVLDCCAAPGNKSAQMAAMMQNTGTLIVNDMDFSRMRAFGQISKRLGLMNVSSCIYDAGNLPKMRDCFDAVMVDVPCSCEGTFRKKWPKPVNAASAVSSRAQAKRQLAILNKAIQLTKPGGRLVYSTCTFSPFENEGVITAALALWGDVIEIVPVSIPNFNLSPGLTSYGEDVFADACQHTARIWPHQNNTGGFFMAHIVKRDVPEAYARAACTLTDIEGDPACDLSPIEERFGFGPDVFHDYAVTAPAKKGWYITPKPHRIPEVMRLDASGLFFYKTTIRFPKLSTAAAMVFGQYATQNRVHLDAKGRDLFFDGADQVLAQAQMDRITGIGYVLVFYIDYCLGMGLYFPPTEAPNDQHRLRSLTAKKLSR